MIVNSRAGLYGSERSLFELVRAFKKFTPHVLLPEDGPLGSLLREEGVEVITLDLEGEGTDRAEDDCVSSLQDLLARYRIGVLHVNKPSCPIRLCREASWRAGIPMIMHTRAEAVIQARDRAHFVRADRHIFVSESTRRFVLSDPLLRDVEKIPRCKTHVVADGRRFEEYGFSEEKGRKLRALLSIPPSDVVVALVGFIDRVKGQHRFIELARQVLQVKAGFTFLIVGGVHWEESRQYKEDLQRKIVEADLQGKVFLTGFLDCREAFSAIDITVSLSQAEGLPGVIIEAMAAQNVVVANSVGGIPEIIDRDGVGFCVEKNDVGAMKKIILDLSEKKDLRSAIGARAKRHVERKFSSDLCAARTEEIYDALARETR